MRRKKTKRRRRRRKKKMKKEEEEEKEENVQNFLTSRSNINLSRKGMPRIVGLLSE